MTTVSYDFTLESIEDPLSSGGDFETSFGGGLRVVDNAGSNNVRVGSANTYQGSNIAAAVGAAGTTQYAELVIGSNSTANDSIGPAVYVNGDNGYFLQIGGIGTTSNNRIYRNVAGVKADLSWTNGVTISVGDTVGLKVTYSAPNATLTFYHNPTTYDGDGFPTNGTQNSVNDTNLSSGQPGLIGYAGSTRAFYATDFYAAGLTASDSIDTIDSPVLDAEQNNAFTYTGFASGVPNSLTIKTAGSEFTSANLLDAAAAGSGTWDMPDVAAYSSNTAGIPFDTASWGSKIVTVTNGTETDTDTTVVNPKTNWHVVEVDTPITTIGSIFYVAGGWDLAAAANTDQVYYYSTEIVDDQAADYFVVAANGTVTTNILTGTVSFLFFDVTTGIWYPGEISLADIFSQSMLAALNVRRSMRRLRGRR